MVERRLQQHTSPLDIGLDKFGRAVDRAVDMRFGREMEDGVRVKRLKGLRHRLPIADVGLTKRITRVRLDRPQRPKISRVGQLIDV